MLQISPYTPLQAIIDAEANTAEAPESFTHLFLQAATVMAAYGDSQQARNATLCAFALRSLPKEDRDGFMASYEVPATVWQMVTARTAPDWPPLISTSPTVSE